MMVSGAFYADSQYGMNCTVGMNAQGEYDWARIYMTDSSGYYVGMGIRDLQERADGQLLASFASLTAPGLALLGPDGSPIWHKRYQLENFPDFNYTYHIQTILEPGDAACVLGYQQNQVDIWMLHVGPDGDLDWGRTYSLGGFWPTGMARAVDGSYYISGLGGLVHLDPDGTFDWRRSYGNIEFNAIDHLSNGDLLLSSNSDDVSLLRLSPTGEPMGSWVSTVDDVGVRLIGVRGDSIYVEHVIGEIGTDRTSAFSAATSVVDLACSFVNATLPTVSMGNGPMDSSSSVIAVDDQLKTWTMNVGVGTSLDDVDLSAELLSGGARPGFEYLLFAQSSNHGGMSSGPLTRTLTFDPLLTFISAEPSQTSVSGNTITWVGTESLQGWYIDHVSAEFQIPADTALMGTEIYSTFSVSQDSTETDLVNNLSAVSQTIVNAYDPNDKLVFPRDFFHIENDSILDYTIRFQNTGTAEAINVVLVDTLPLDVDVSTFRFLGSSHPCTYTLTGNGILTFTFDNILLPDSNTNEPLSHGLVNFRIKPILPLQLGQEITNAADIYFDFNPPIRTPDATVIVTDETGVRPLVKPAELLVYPVPVKNNLTVVIPEGFTPVQAFAVGVDGRRGPLLLPPSNSGQVQFATQHLPSGAYVLTLRAQDGRRLSARFVKE